MATKIGQAFLELLMDDSQLGKGLQQAETTTTTWAGQLGGKLQSMLPAITTGAIAAAVVGGLALVGKASIGIADQVNVATGHLAAELGIASEEAERYANIAAAAWKDNFFESVEESADVVAMLRQQLGDLSDDELLRATENAARLSDVFEFGFEETTDTVNVLMEEMGLSVDEAYDFIAAGAQRGLNANDDFLDSVREYGGLFSEAGFSAEQMFSIMETGAAGGVLGTDKVSDAIKEMLVRLNEGGDDVSEAFTAMGLDFDRISGFIASGDEAWADYFPAIIQGLQSIEDPLQRSQLEIALFGTMAEDLGQDFVEGLDPALVSLDDMAGKVGLLDQEYASFSDMWEGLKRRVLVAIEPIGSKLLDLANEYMPYVEQALGFLEAKLPGVIDAFAVGVDWIIANLVPALISAREWFNETIKPVINQWVPVIMDQLMPGLQQLGEWIRQLAEALLPVLADAWQFVTDHMDIILPVLAVVGVAILALSSPITLIAGAIIAFATAWANNWGGIQDKVQAFGNWWNTSVQPWFDSVFGIIGELFAAFKSAFEGDWYAFGEHLREAWDRATQLMVDIATRLADGIKNAIVKLVTNAVDTIKNTDWLELGKNIIRGIGSGITSMNNWIADQARAAAQAALDAAKGFLGIHSKSKVMEEQVGENIGLGISSGIGNTIGQIQAAMDAALQIPAVGLQPAGAGAGAGGGIGSVIVNFYGPAPSTDAEADAVVDRMVEAMRRAGLT